MDLITTVSGFFVGMLVGATGVGGGSLMTPLLVLVMGVAPATAVGTDLLYASITKVGGAWAHGKRNNIDWRICGLLALGSLPAAAATLVLLHSLSVDADQYAIFLKKCLGVALILSAVALLLKDRLHMLALRRSGGKAPSERSPSATVVTGAIVGALVTATSVGAGALGVAALLFLYPT
ncbi:MAG TPA: sulfite exporter TauE/SafE family protein, partial [Pseudomonadales bacterium]